MDTDEHVGTCNDLELHVRWIAVKGDHPHRIPAEIDLVDGRNCCARVDDAPRELAVRSADSHVKCQPWITIVPHAVAASRQPVGFRSGRLDQSPQAAAMTFGSAALSAAHDESLEARAYGSGGKIDNGESREGCKEMDLRRGLIDNRISVRISVRIDYANLLLRVEHMTLRCRPPALWCLKKSTPAARTEQAVPAGIPPSSSSPTCSRTLGEEMRILAHPRPGLALRPE
eukprot:2881262-Prymnesium_polylepis.3